MKALRIAGHIIPEWRIVSLEWFDKEHDSDSPDCGGCISGYTEVVVEGLCYSIAVPDQTPAQILAGPRFDMETGEETHHCGAAVSASPLMEAGGDLAGPGRVPTVDPRTDEELLRAYEASLNEKWHALEKMALARIALHARGYKQQGGLWVKGADDHE